MKPIHKQWLTVIIIIVVLVAGVWLYSAKTKKSTNEDIQQTSQSLNQEADKEPATQQETKQEGNVWEGTLQKSDNSKKGNLMLVTDKRTIYIYTSRDFSALIGKKVQVTYDGTLDSFRLGDITAK